MDELSGMIHSELENLVCRLFDFDESEDEHPSEEQMELVDDALRGIMDDIIAQYPV